MEDLGCWLKEVMGWMRENKLTFNFNRTEVLLVGPDLSLEVGIYTWNAGLGTTLSKAHVVCSHPVQVALVARTAFHLLQLG